MGTLDSTVLRQLYSEQHCSDDQIGAQFGVSQGTVCRLRKKWGIPTLLKSDRLKLPEVLSDRQRSLLIGSMLGDGWLFRTGAETAAYSEYHSLAQADYLAWKAKEWGQFTSRIRQVCKRSKKSKVGLVLTLHASRLFRPYWEQFYPDGHGGKVLCVTRSQVDSLALAVWFMDDGGKTPNGYARFSVGPDERSQRAQLGVLKSLGLRPTLYPSGGDFEILIDDRTSYARFVELVAPHVIPSMSYKLDVQPRKAGKAPRDILTREKLQELLGRGLTHQAISEVTGISRSSVGRIANTLGFSVRMGRPKLSSLLSAQDAKEAIEALSPISEEAVLEILLRTKLPVRRLSSEEAAHDFAVLTRAPTFVEGDTIARLSQGGAALCHHVFPYMAEAVHYKRGLSLREAWSTAEHVRAAIQYQLRHGHPVTPVRVMRAVRLGITSPTNFRPCSAKALVEHFSPEGGVVLDPCAGYGGRALGTLAAGRCYVGVDPHPNAAEAYQELSRLTGRSLRFHNEAFEDVDLDALQADMVLTSPPYYSVERYSNDTRQSWVRYKTWDLWNRGFLIPFVDKIWAHLKPGRVAVINTKNVRMRAREYPIADILLEVARIRGFVLEQTLRLPLGRLKQARFEPLFVFRRPL